jgi:hypothetical protein
MTAPLPIDRALTDPRLLGAALGNASSWSTWIAVLRACFGLPLDEQQRRVFASVAGGRSPPTRRVREFWGLIGRKGGKSKMAAAISVYAALFVKHKLSRGERGLVLVLAMSVDQARVVFNYCLGFLNASEALRKEVVDVTRSEIRLRNGIVIAVHANSFRSVRGRSLVACVLDEVCFWRDDSTATPDAETYTALLPALLTTDGLLVAISSAYRRVGLFYTKHRDYFGVDSDDTLVVAGSSQTFNGTLDAGRIAAMRAADPLAAKSEWDSEFRDDLASFLDDAVIDRCIDRGRPLELPPDASRFYVAGVDPSGGAAGGDAYSFCISHKEKDGRFVVDLVRGRTGPFNVDDVTAEYAALCKEYRIGRVVGDAYGREWVAQAWQKTGVRYEKAELNASMIYLESLPLWTRGLVEIPDHPALVRELRLLERIPGRIGKDQVTHPRNCRDDLANSTCIALVEAAAGQSREWLRPENLRRVTAEIAMRPKYRRPLGDERTRNAEAIFGERKAAQIAAMANRRRYGW